MLNFIMIYYMHSYLAQALIRHIWRQSFAWRQHTLFCVDLTIRRQATQLMNEGWLAQNIIIKAVESFILIV
jgi:hypothetical protein